MPRSAKLRRKNGYWYSRAGSESGVYFGKISEIPYAEANKRFRKHLASLTEERQLVALPRLSVAEVVDRYVGWIEKNRSNATFSQRKSILEQFCLHTIDKYLEERLAGHGTMIAKLRASQLTRPHLEQYLEHCKDAPREKTGKPYGDKSLRAIVVAAKACWNWAADSKKNGGGGLLDEDERPLSRMPLRAVGPRDLTETDLPTDEEVEILFRWGAVEPSQVRAGRGGWRRRRPDEYYTYDSKVFAEMLQLYHGTGARTSELCEVKVRDFMPRTGQLCLGKHKRVHTQSNPTLRTIQLDDELVQLLLPRMERKKPTERLFTHENGNAWDRDQINKRLNKVIELAVEHGQIVRSHITPYSFRHLYISELLMLGAEPFKVGKMAGTSVKEIQRTYGHFFNEDLAATQAKLKKARKKRKKKRQKQQPK